MSVINLRLKYTSILSLGLIEINILSCCNNSPSEID